MQIPDNIIKICDDFKGEKNEDLNQILRKEFDMRELNCTSFCVKTGLSEGIFKKICNNTQGDIQLRSLIAIIIGLNFNEDIAKKCISLAGYYLEGSFERKLYREMVFGSLKEYIRASTTPIESANAILIQYGFSELNRRNSKNSA